jgi:phage gp16-like protein
MPSRDTTCPTVLPPRRGAPPSVPARTAPDAEAMRRKLQVARRQMALTDEQYRDILARVTGQSSSKALDAGQLHAVLADLRRLGWQARPARKRAFSSKPQVRMIHALWAELAPFVASHDEAALRAFVRRQTKTPATPDGVDAPAFLDAAQATRVLEGLKAWLARERAKLQLAEGQA